MRNDLSEVRLVTLPRHGDAQGELVVLEQGVSMSFAAPRVFTVRAGAGATRGKHAHRRCTQLLVCVHGAIDVECDDGSARVSFALDAGSKALLIPPGIWATQRYLVENAVLTVLCDRPYEASDYLRDYTAFLAWRAATTIND